MPMASKNSISGWFNKKAGKNPVWAEVRFDRWTWWNHGLQRQWFSKHCKGDKTCYCLSKDVFFTYQINNPTAKIHLNNQYLLVHLKILTTQRCRNSPKRSVVHRVGCYIEWKTGHLGFHQDSKIISWIYAKGERHISQHFDKKNI